MSELNTLLMPLIEGFSDWRNVRGMVEVAPEDIPQPYRNLLVHQRDMTGTLTQFFDQGLHLRVLEKNLRNQILARRVLLLTNNDETPVEYGAIRIHLANYPQQAQSLILEGSQPLGAILNELKIVYKSQPRRFIQLQESDILKEVFQIPHAISLYGRCNTLTTPEGQNLAEIVEVLPPLEQK